MGGYVRGRTSKTDRQTDTQLTETDLSESRADDVNDMRNPLPSLFPLAEPTHPPNITSVTSCIPLSVKRPTNFFPVPVIPLAVEMASH